MKTLFYSTKIFEQPSLESANGNNYLVDFIKDPLSLETVNKAAGFEIISIFTADDCSDNVLEKLQQLGVKYIATRATGHDNINLQKATELGISVANVPAYSPYAIAEHSVALILALNRKLLIADKQIHSNDFTTTNLIGYDLHGKTVGIIGVGKIGSVFAKIMHGFGCKLLGYDIEENGSLKQQYGLEYVTLESLCSKADIISINTGLTPQTKYLINKTLIAQMRPGTMLINTGRGACVHTADVIAGLENGQLGYFGADVYEGEKGIFFNDLTDKGLQDPVLKKLLGMPNVIITPHQGFATKEAITNIAEATFYNITCWIQKQISKNELTEPKRIVEELGNENN